MWAGLSSTAAAPIMKGDGDEAERGAEEALKALELDWD
jgi:hypothetical protein